MKYHMGQKVIINARNGDGIYDGKSAYIQGISFKYGNEPRYLLCEYRQSVSLGWARESQLTTDWQVAAKSNQKRREIMRRMLTNADGE